MTKNSEIKEREPELNYPCPKSAFPLKVDIETHGNFGKYFIVYPNCTILTGHANEIADSIENLKNTLHSIGNEHVKS